MDEPRELLARLAAERGADLATLSRLIGRNDAYVQQFIRRGTPRRLAEADRHRLAEFFEVEPHLLGGPPPPPPPDVVSVRRLDLQASAGPGRVAEGERPSGTLAMDAAALRRLGVGSRARLSAIRVSGDSMQPTLRDGDDLLVDGDDGASRLRDGLYVVRVGDQLLVKRVAVVGRRLTLHSDNPAYPPVTGLDPGEIAVVGRAIWVGRRLA